METNFTWKIDNMYRNDQGMVNTVFWTLVAEKSGVTDKTSGATELTPSDDPIPFENLTQEIVSSWLESIIDEERINDLKLFLTQQIDYYLGNSNSDLNISGTPENFEGLPPNL